MNFFKTSINQFGQNSFVILVVLLTTRETRKFGEDNAYIEDPKVKVDIGSDYRGYDISYTK